MQDVDQLGGPQLHLDHVGVDLVLEMAIEDERRYGDGDAEGGVVQRNGDAVRELLRIGAGRRLRAEDLDHADHRAEQAEQRRGGGDRAQRGQEALELVRHAAPRLLDRKSTRLNSSHLVISYAVFCLKKKTSIRHYILAPYG